VRESSRVGIVIEERGPYRTAAPPVRVVTSEGPSPQGEPSPGTTEDTSHLDAILRRVADGSLSPRDASSLLRALGAVGSG